jgi:hypothetical protein
VQGRLVVVGLHAHRPLNDDRPGVTESTQ